MNKADTIAAQYAAVNTTPVLPSVFTIKPASQWMQEASERPIAKKLFGSLWNTGELSVLFADTGVGKTMLAVQIADAISKGTSFLPFVNETEAQKVLYIDFELTDRQFQIRYSCKTTGQMYRFSSNFLRAEISCGEEITDEMIMASIEASVISTGAACIVIDNITYLNGETEKGKHALPLMKGLNSLKKNYDLSILVLAHTPKRDGTRAIYLSDLYGSVMIANFIDGAFAIARSNDGPSYRYLKQLKARSDEVEYHDQNVPFIELVKSDNMMKFTFNDFTTEEQHLKITTQSQREELVKRIHELHDAGRTQSEIANEIDRSVGFVNKYLKR